ncbi:MAG: hypothetical protein LLG08_06175 [Actinomycetia bacterium]|nr:hypothetical protein [Actinomycetes bacterium]
MRCKKLQEFEQAILPRGHHMREPMAARMIDLRRLLEDDSCIRKSRHGTSVLERLAGCEEGRPESPGRHLNKEVSRETSPSEILYSAASHFTPLKPPDERTLLALSLSVKYPAGSYWYAAFRGSPGPTSRDNHDDTA